MNVLTKHVNPKYDASLHFFTYTQPSSSSSTATAATPWRCLPSATHGLPRRTEPGSFECTCVTSLVEENEECSNLFVCACVQCVQCVSCGFTEDVVVACNIFKPNLSSMFAPPPSSSPLYLSLSFSFLLSPLSTPCPPD